MIIIIVIVITIVGIVIIIIMLMLELPPDDGSPENENRGGDVLALGHEDVHGPGGQAGDARQHHSDREPLIDLYGVEMEDTHGRVEYEWRSTDQDDARQEEHTRTDLDRVESLVEHQDGEEDGDHGTGEDDAQGVRDVHEGDAGEGTDEGDGAS